MLLSAQSCSSHHSIPIAGDHWGWVLANELWSIGAFGVDVVLFEDVLASGCLRPAYWLVLLVLWLQVSLRKFSHLAMTLLRRIELTSARRCWFLVPRANGRALTAILILQTTFWWAVLVVGLLVYSWRAGTSCALLHYRDWCRQAFVPAFLAKIITPAALHYLVGDLEWAHGFAVPVDSCSDQFECFF